MLNDLFKRIDGHLAEAARLALEHTEPGSEAQISATHRFRAWKQVRADLEALMEEQEERV